MLMSASPGILDGDDYTLEINLAAGCSVEWLTQSYQRLFHMKQGARQTMHINLQENASLRFLPHPVVPHEAADFVSRSRIMLSKNCLLSWGEVVTCGRRLNDEIFRFTRYHAITEIYLDGKLVIRENLLMQPGTSDPRGLGQLEGYTHQAGFIFLNEKVAVNSLIAAAREWLAPQENIIFGVTAAPVNGIIVRILGHKAEQLHYCIKMIADMMQGVSPAAGHTPEEAVTAAKAAILNLKR
jgi:urease accessory protein